MGEKEMAILELCKVEIETMRSYILGILIRNNNKNNKVDDIQFHRLDRLRHLILLCEETFNLVIDYEKGNFYEE